MGEVVFVYTEGDDGGKVVLVYTDDDAVKKLGGRG